MPYDTIQVERTTKEQLVRLKGELTWKTGQDCTFSETLHYLLSLVSDGDHTISTDWRPPARPVTDRQLANFQMRLRKAGGKISQRELLRALHVTAAQLVSLAEELIEQGAIHAHTDSSHPGKRRVFYTIAPTT